MATTHTTHHPTGPARHQYRSPRWWVIVLTVSLAVIAGGGWWNASQRADRLERDMAAARQDTQDAEREARQWRQTARQCQKAVTQGNDAFLTLIDLTEAVNNVSLVDFMGDTPSATVTSAEDAMDTLDVILPGYVAARDACLNPIRPEGLR